MKTHLKKLFTRLAEHHTTKSAHHTSMAADFGKLATMGKAHGNGLVETAEAMSDAHAEMAAEHAGMAEACVSCCKAMEEATHKAMGFDLDQLEPSPIRAVVPDVPRGVHMVLRAGMTVQKTNVPTEFQKLVSTDFDQE